MSGAADITGSCLCGAITFTVTGAPSEVNACHCTQCRKNSGHYWAAADVHPDQLTVQGDVTWYRSSAYARRGFCATCGSFLFFDPVDKPHWTSVSMGAMDSPTCARLERHIHTGAKGDYYEISDGLPQRER